MTRIEKVRKALEMGLEVKDRWKHEVRYCASGDSSGEYCFYHPKDDREYWESDSDLDDSRTMIDSTPIDQWQPEAEEPTWTEAEIREAFKFSRLAYQEPSISIENYVDGLIGDIIDNLKEKQS